jgi:NADP-dependent 3-hydroxy acid dehydrogenase YdfG
MKQFSGQTVVITGAAGGVGQAIADCLITAGAKALLVGRSEESLGSLVRQHGWEPAAVSCCPVDLCVPSEIARFVSHIRATGAQVDQIIHAAGIIMLDDPDDEQLRDFDAQYQVNVRAPYQLTRGLLPHLIKCAGQVVFINSSVGVHARRGVGQYAASKHALRAIADSLREEVNEHGVRVLSVFLGRTASRMQQAVHEQEGRPYRPEVLLQPSDVASMVVAALALPRTAEVTDLHIRPMLKA